MADSLLANLAAATVFAVLGVVVFVIAFFLFDKLTPGDLWDEIMRGPPHGAGDPHGRGGDRAVDHHRGGHPLTRGG
jgi:hypothetical protein